MVSCSVKGLIFLREVSAEQFRKLLAYYRPREWSELLEGLGLFEECPKGSFEEYRSGGGFRRFMVPCRKPKTCLLCGRAYMRMQMAKVLTRYEVLQRKFGWFDVGRDVWTMHPVLHERVTYGEPDLVSGLVWKICEISRKLYDGDVGLHVNFQSWRTKNPFTKGNYPHFQVMAFLLDARNKFSMVNPFVNLSDMRREWKTAQEDVCGVVLPKGDVDVYHWWLDYRNRKYRTVYDFKAAVGAAARYDNRMSNFDIWNEWSLKGCRRMDEVELDRVKRLLMVPRKFRRQRYGGWMANSGLKRLREEFDVHFPTRKEYLAGKRGDWVRGKFSGETGFHGTVVW